MEPSSLEIQIQDFLSKVPNKPIVIAYSGGLDSMVLLHLLSRYIADTNLLQAIYINHQLQSESDDWATFCQKTCQSLGINYQSISVEIIQTQRKGIEAVAREKRYQALFDAMKNNSVLVTGHHLKDQAETTLMALLRGSGVAGLAAMPIVKLIAGGKKGEKKVQHYRPLLSASESSFKNYAKVHHLNWVEDPSNNLLSFKRNFIRHQVLPVLKQVSPAPLKNIAKSASLMSESLELMDDLAKLDLQGCLVNKIFLPLIDLSWVRQKNIIRYWFKHFLPIQLNSSILSWLKICIENKNPEALPILKLSRSELRYYNKNIFYIPDTKKEFFVNLSDFKFLDFGFSSTVFEKVDLNLTQENLSQAKVREIQQRDEIDFKALKKWFKKQKIPPWERTRWPVIELNGKVVAIFGFQ